MRTSQPRLATIALLLGLATTSACSDDGAEATASGAGGAGGQPSANTGAGAGGDPSGGGATSTSTASAGSSTGGAGGEAPIAGPCWDVDASALPIAPVADNYALGGFRAEVGNDARLVVRHANEPDRVIYASAIGAAFEAARGTLEAHEHQGSFTIDEAIDAACREPVLVQLREGDGVLAATGAFADANPDCADLDWQLTLCEAAPGHLAFHLTTSDPSFERLTLRAESTADEAIFGAGEQFGRDRIDRKGRLLPILAQEGGVGRGHLPISPAVNAVSEGSAGSEDSTYYAAPHVLTSRLRSLFLENVEYSELDLRPADASEIRVWSPAMTGRILYGASPLELVERFTDYAGRMPPLPDWVGEGAIVALAKKTPESEAFVDALLDGGVELAAVWNQTWSGKVTTYIGEQVLWNWTLNDAYHPAWSSYVDGLADRGVRTLCYVNPMLVEPPADAPPPARELFAEAIANDYLVKRDDGTPYLLPVTAFDAGLIDLSNPAARAWMKDVLITEVMGTGRCSGWMVDFAEALPFDAVLANGETGATYHNQYPVEWMRLNREAIEEAGRLGDVVTWNRAGFTTTPRHSLLLWEGDQLTTWDKFDGLVSALHGLVGGGFSGIALNHSDTGGYTSLSYAGLVGYEREREQLQRWTEMNAFTAVLRTHEGNQPGVNAQVYSNAEAIAHFARFSKVFKALAPYRKQLMVEASQKGWPLVRHLWMHYPDDATARATDDEFLLGSEILVAPIKNKCWTQPLCPYDKEVYLPKGEWTHLWSGKNYGSATQGKTVSVKAPIGQPAVFYRKGSTVGASFVAALGGLGIAVPPAQP